MADEVQINANDILSAFAVENANLIQRLVVAELRVKALERALEETKAELAKARTPVVDDADALSPE
jgi:hypothetical protein